MDPPGTPERPLAVAVVGSGPAGFYAVQALFAASGLNVRVDMFERLPAPFGLVRYGVAPDHPKIKSVVAVYDKLAARPGYRFFGNVCYGRDLTFDDLARHYHQVVFTTGAQTDRALGIPGEELRGSHAATEFVAWYNGHPDYRERRFDLNGPGAVVIGVGNVAVDVARILCRTPAELERTDIADHALAALRESRVREVHLLGRRGPLQAAFTNPEVKELGEMEGACATTIPGEVELDPLSREELETADRATRRKVDILQSLAGRDQPDTPRRLFIRFLVSPVEILGDAEGRVRAVRLTRNELYRAEDGSLRSRPNGQTELIEAGLVLRSVGYRGLPVEGLPFDERRGIVPNDRGRVLDAHGEGPLRGVYVSGWIKRGPTGVIGTNKPDAAETVAAMLEDRERGWLFSPARPEPAAIEARLAARGVRFVSYEDWRRLDAAEVALGGPRGRPRIKLTRIEEVWRTLDG